MTLWGLIVFLVKDFKIKINLTDMYTNLKVDVIYITTWLVYISGCKPLFSNIRNTSFPDFCLRIALMFTLLGQDST